MKKLQNILKYKNTILIFIGVVLLGTGFINGNFWMYFMFLFVSILLVGKEDRLTPILLLGYSILLFPAAIFTLLVHIEGVSFYVLGAYICSFIGLFFIKRMPFLILLPLIPLGIVGGLFYYGDSIEKGELCSYIRDGTRGNCECDGFILNYSQVGYCQGERLSCSVFTGSYMDPYIYEPISCEDYALPNKGGK